MYLFIHTHVHAYVGAIYAFTSQQTHTHMHAPEYTRMYTWVCLFASANQSAHICTYRTLRIDIGIHIHIPVVYVCVHMGMCILVYIFGGHIDILMHVMHVHTNIPVGILLMIHVATKPLNQH